MFLKLLFTCSREYVKLVAICSLYRDSSLNFPFAQVLSLGLAVLADLFLGYEIKYFSNMRERDYYNIITFIIFFLNFTCCHAIKAYLFIIGTPIVYLISFVFSHPYIYCTTARTCIHYIVNVYPLLR